MKKILAMVMALALCVCAAAACAETTVESKVIEAYNLELNTKANTLVLTDGKTYEKYVVDTEGNKLSDSFAYISSNDGFYTVGNEDLHLGLLDGQGKQLLFASGKVIGVMVQKRRQVVGQHVCGSFRVLQFFLYGVAQEDGLHVLGQKRQAVLIKLLAFVVLQLFAEHPDLSAVRL